MMLDMLFSPPCRCAASIDTRHAVSLLRPRCGRAHVFDVLRGCFTLQRRLLARLLHSTWPAFLPLLFRQRRCRHLRYFAAASSDGLLPPASDVCTPCYQIFTIATDIDLRLPMPLCFAADVHATERCAAVTCLVLIFAEQQRDAVFAMLHAGAMICCRFSFEFMLRVFADISPRPLFSMRMPLLPLLRRAVYAFADAAAADFRHAAFFFLPCFFFRAVAMRHCRR